ncbi:MAG: GAF domain-containing protein [Candidatus Tyrphobacter sp.]
MSSGFWKGIALAIIALAIVYTCLGGDAGLQPGDYGIDNPFTALRPGGFVLPSVPPGSSLSRAGLHAGEHLRLLNSSLAARAALAYPLPGSHVEFVTTSGRTITLVARPAPRQWLPWTIIVVKLAFLIVAGLLVLRRWRERAVRSLVYFLTGFGIALTFANSPPVRLPVVSLLLFGLGTGVLIVAAGAAAADFSAHLSSAPGVLERNLARAASIAAAVAILINASLFLFAFDQRMAMLGSALAGLLYFLPFLLAIATLIVGFTSARGPERRRRLWVLVIIGIGLLGPAVDILVGAAAGYNAALDQVALATVAIVPVGLAYVILRHRLIDVGFVLNQATVFAGVSIVIVGIIVIVETLLSKYVESTSHITSTAVQVAVALALGFSINAIHKRVDRIVDRLFFRKRHEAETALYDFAQDAAYVTDEGLLVERCARVVQRHGQAQRAAVWMLDGVTERYELRAGSLRGAPVDRNDPAIVAMRARRIVADLHACGSALPGILAFPMTAGGDLLGVVLCDEKRDQESYAPDERAAIERVAEAVGHAYATLQVNALRREIERLRPSVRPGDATEGALPAL